MTRSNKLFTFILVTLVTAAGCNDFLDVKPKANLAVPSSPDDLQALLDVDFKMNGSGPVSNEISADDIYIPDESYTSLGEDERRIYIWAPAQLFVNENSNDWVNGYSKVYVANVVLDNIDELYGQYQARALNNIKGQALFHRSFRLFQLAAIFSFSYKPGTEQGQGIPLRLSSDLNEKITRSSQQQTFDRIIGDLKQACSLLEVNNTHVLRASKPAAYALLSRIFLYIGDYGQASLYADSCLQLKNTLLSYNTPDIPDLDARYPFNDPSLLYKNPEIIFSSKTGIPPILSPTYMRMDSALIKMYAPGDNRLKVFFNAESGGNGSFSFKGSYEGANGYFEGLSTDEVYLVKAECDARLNHAEAAMQTLNHLLKSRWDRAVTYKDLSAGSPEEALAIILLERRKSLVMRGLRWLDIKRLNNEGGNLTLERKVNGSVYTLPPNDLRYALAIPESIIAASGISQNPR